MLFGSLARSDQVEGSDTDLLMVNIGDETRHVSVGHLSLFLYPWRKLEEDARNGDLFVCHLVHEAKPLIDPDDYFPRLVAAFAFRSNYLDEIERATDFGWYLVNFGEELNSALLKKRALWCVRTILIARSAERRDPVFSPDRLAALTLSSAGRDLLTNRHAVRDDMAVRQSLRLFLEEETPVNSLFDRADRQSYIDRFVANFNKVAMQTLQQEENSQAGYFA